MPTTKQLPEFKINTSLRKKNAPAQRQKVSLVPGQVVAMHPMAVHGVAPNTTARPRTTLYYRLVVRGRVAGRTICNTDMYADPWCEMPVMRGCTCYFALNSIAAQN